MELVIKNGLVYTGGRFAERQVYIKDGVIAQVAPRAEAPAGCPELDLGGKRLAPGFIDVHTHGGAGVDVNAATAEQLNGTIGRFFASQGTTGWPSAIRGRITTPLWPALRMGRPAPPTPSTP